MSYLEFHGISKSFPGVKALDDVSLSVAKGSVHGLVGENGAGKSTLLKILGGEYVPDAGAVQIAGLPRRFGSAADSIGAGIAIIHQELQYVPDLSVVENLLLGHLPTRAGVVRKKAALALVREELAKMGVTDIDPLALLRELSIGQRQMVEICKALMRHAEIIAFDEPTSSLSHHETEILFRQIRELKRQNKAVIYISHRLEEIFGLCDSCTIFRDGRRVATHADIARVTAHQLVNDMVGREIADIYDYRPRPLGAVRFEVEKLMGPALSKPITFQARQGEIVGFFGLVGAGRSELMRTIYGADRRLGGRVRLDQRELDIRRVSHAIHNGIVFCPEDRKEEGIVGCRSVSENINISCRRHTRWLRYFVNDAREAETADDFIRRLQIKTPGRGQLIRLLSGGNQQKVILARWLAERDVKVIIVDEPTRGIDVGAKNEIYSVMYRLAEQGCTIIVVSSDLPEVLGISDRIVVMRQGRIVGELPRADANEQKVLNLALPN